MKFVSRVGFDFLAVTAGLALIISGTILASRWMVPTDEWDLDDPDPDGQTILVFR